jgi:hypothetical protein
VLCQLAAVILLVLGWAARLQRNAGYRRGVDTCVTRNGDDIRGQVRSLREQAARCRRLADTTTDDDVARRLLQLASEFEQQASKLETENSG